MSLFTIGQKVNKHLKYIKKQKAGIFVSPVRRIEFVYPLPGERLCAMTFDDGPCAAAPTGLDVGLTQHLISVLADFDARATFDIIGDTSFNYPDQAGKLNTAYWGGKKFDHYPDINCDNLAGALHQPELVRKLLAHGHELSNHGYRHMIFGPMRAIYGRREYFPSVQTVLDDLDRLHQLVKREFNYKFKLSRPPHYIDNIKGGFTSYDAYEYMGYNYMAASFDGGGWLPSTGDMATDVEKMVLPLKKALAENPEALNGKIIFQKDGYNMSKKMPIAFALAKQLEVLKEYGYKVIPVGELIELSPFEDLPPNASCFEAAQGFLKAGKPVGYKNNTFQAQRIMSLGEALALLAPPAEFSKRLLAKISGQATLNGITVHHPYAGALAWAKENGIVNWLNKKSELDSELLGEILVNIGYNITDLPNGKLNRAQGVKAIWQALQNK